jgi:hypothetical protein
MRTYKTIEVKQYEEMLKAIGRSNLIAFENFELLLYGGGGQDKKFYSDLRQNTKCEVLWTGWSGPKWSSIFSFIPGQAGLIKVLDMNVFEELYYELAAHSVSDVIYVPKELSQEIIADVKEKTWRANFESFVKRVPNSFVLTSEADETVEENGKEMYFYDYAFGSELSHLLRDIIERKT